MSKLKASQWDTMNLPSNVKDSKIAKRIYIRDVTTEEEDLYDPDFYNNYLLSKDQKFKEDEDEPKVKLMSRDPSECKNISLGSDLYSLTWYSLKKSSFENKEIRGVPISLLPQDYFLIYFHFIVFALVVMLTMSLIVTEALLDDVYTEPTVTLVIIRMMLVAFTEFNISPEIAVGWAKFVYTLSHPTEFYHANFALFVGFCHIFVNCITMFGLIIFVTMADEFADPVINFGGICVLTEFDNWIADNIKTYKIKSDELKEVEPELEKESGEDDEAFEERLKSYNHRKQNAEIINDMYLARRSRYDLENLNERISLYAKLAMIDEDELDIQINDVLYEKCPYRSIVFFQKLCFYFPWKYFLPLSTIPLNYILPYITEYLRSKYLKHFTLTNQA